MRYAQLEQGNSGWKQRENSLLAEIEVYKRRIEDLNKIIKENEEWKAKYY